MTAVDFVGPRGMGVPGSPRDVSRGVESPGEESRPDAIAAQVIEAQPSFGQIKSWKGRVVRAPNSMLGRNVGGLRTSCTRGQMFFLAARNSRASASDCSANRLGSLFCNRSRFCNFRRIPGIRSKCSSFKSDHSGRLATSESKNWRSSAAEMKAAQYTPYSPKRLRERFLEIFTRSA